MLITKEIMIVITHSNKGCYLKLYPELKIGDTISIPIEELSKGSHKKITAQCDGCGLEKLIPYRDYLSSMNNGGYFSCAKCKGNKTKKTNIMKYGVSHPMQSNDIKGKTTKTILDKYGVENVFQCESIKEKIKNTIYDKYGVEYYSQIEDIKFKIKKTNLLKYGHEHHLQNKDILDKQHETNLERYGCIVPSQNKEVIKKIVEKSLSTRKKNFININSTINIINVDYSGKTFSAYCDKGCEHYFEIDFSLFQNRKYLNNTICTICNPRETVESDSENNLYDFIKLNYDGLILKNDRSIIDFEIDVYLPELKLGFEYNGLYWHSEIHKDCNYHKHKTDLAEEKGIKLIQIYENDWLFKQKIVKSNILYLLGKSDKIYAKKCEIKEIDKKHIHNFLENNHIQGYVPSSINIGLFYNDRLVYIMNFSELRISTNENTKDGVYELLRYCSLINTSIVGGAGKIFKYFIKKYNPKQIVSYADRSWPIGSIHLTLAFKFQHNTNPNYHYIIGKKKYHKYNFRKNILVKMGFDRNKTEHQIMLERKIYRIYDSGSMKFIWTS